MNITAVGEFQMPVWAQWADWVLACLGNIAVVAGVIGVVVAFKTFKKTVNDSDEERLTTRMTNSIEVMRIFSDVIIPQMTDYDKKFKKDYEKRRSSVIIEAKEQNPDFSEEMIPEVLDDVLRQLAQINSDCSSVFNKMEQACAYIKCGLVLDDLVYPPLHSVFLRFVESNMDALNRLTTPDVPYGNVHYVLSKWGKKAKNESIDRRQRELDEERSEILSTLI